MKQYLPENLGFSQYYSSNDAMIIIGDVFVDEAVAITYSLRESKIPIYSYNSKFFKKVAPGKVLVQGTITINYISDDYFENILRDQQNKKLENVRTLSFENNVYSKVEELFRDDKKQISQSDTLNLMKAISQNPFAKNEIIAAIKNRKEQFRQSLLQKPVLGNIAESPIELTGSLNTTNLKLFSEYGPVNILVSHNNPLTVDNDVTRIIKNVHFLGLEHMSQPSGQPQTETYSFFAERVI